MIEPLLFRVLVKKFKLEDTDPTYRSAHAAGIVIPKAAERMREEQAVDRGTVVAVGPQAFEEWGAKGLVNVGDEVFFAKYAGKPITDPYTNEDYLALNDEDIVVRIIKESN